MEIVYLQVSGDTGADGRHPVAMGTWTAGDAAPPELVASGTVPSAPPPDGASFCHPTSVAAPVPERYRSLFSLGYSISGFHPVGGNTARLLLDSNTTIDTMVADIDAAIDHVHLLFYIWLPDTNGRKIVEALKRAASRGVVCRAMADDLGSRAMIRSTHWEAMRAAGVRVASGLPIGNPLLRPFMGRIDLRNHRKIVVIDDRITYCGSQNCADPEFLVKAKYAPWVDAVMRFLLLWGWCRAAKRGYGGKLSPRAKRGTFEAAGKVPRRARNDSGTVFGICDSGYRDLARLTSAGYITASPRRAMSASSSSEMYSGVLPVSAHNCSTMMLRLTSLTSTQVR